MLGLYIDVNIFGGGGVEHNCSIFQVLLFYKVCPF